MQIRVGFEITVECENETPLLLALSPRPEEERRVVGSSRIGIDPDGRLEMFLDQFGNRRTRLVAAPGRTRLRSDFIVMDTGMPDNVDVNAQQHPVESLPTDVLPYLCASRYCEVDQLNAEAWRLFANSPAGWPRVQAICDFVHNHISFGYQHARSTRTALDGYREGTGVCRDFAHLAITLCRAMNIPARYASGYLGDIAWPASGPGDFCAWMEVYLGGRWHTFDARYNVPRIGRVLMSYGRDAADVAMITSFGNCPLTNFIVWADEVGESAAPLGERSGGPPLPALPAARELA